MLFRESEINPNFFSPFDNKTRGFFNEQNTLGVLMSRFYFEFYDTFRIVFVEYFLVIFRSIRPLKYEVLYTSKIYRKADIFSRQIKWFEFVPKRTRQLNLRN